MRSFVRPARAACLMVTFGLVAAACGGSGSGKSDAADGDTTAATTVAPTATAPPPERCDWELNTVGFWEQEPPTELGTAEAHGHGQGNEDGAQAWAPLDDPERCGELGDQVDAMEAVAAKYPTMQDALDAQCFKATIFVQGIAAHLYCVPNHAAGTDIEHPTMLLYGGNTPSAPIVGLSYMVYQESQPSEDADADLWVKYMPWHFHEGLCLKGGMVIGGDNSDPASCEARGGKVQGRTGWMGHYWLPSCPSPDGVFSAANPRLDWGVGTFNDENADDPDLVEQPCRGSKMPVKPNGADSFGRPEGMDPRHGLDHGEMDHEDMDHGEMDHGEAAA